jgi:MFS family permease
MFPAYTARIAPLVQVLSRLRKRPRPWGANYSSTVPHPSKQDEARRFNSTKSIGTVGIDATEVYQYLNLESFSDDEFKSVFGSIQLSHEDTSSADKPVDLNIITPDHLSSFLEKRIETLEGANSYRSEYDDEFTTSLRKEFAATETKRCWEFVVQNIAESQKKETISEDEFCSAMKTSASLLDTKRIWPLTLSMVLVGSSVGVVTPAMPFVVQNLGLTAGQYGIVVSAFALSKMIGNIPSAVLVERHGRKPYLVYSMAAIAVGVGGIGLASSFEELYLCRLFTGMGVASLSAAVTMTVTDISTPLNRASSFAPVMSAFSAGTALGPALGGILCDQIGINPTFYVVGVSYFGLAAVNNYLLNETQPRDKTFPWQKPPETAEQPPTIGESFQTALGMWIPLLSMPPVRNVCIMNAFYWMGLAGSQMTLLPLILTNADGLAMSATSVGQVYMGMSVVQVLGNPLLAKVVDQVGKVPGIVGGCTLISFAMASLPFCNEPYEMAGVLGVWAVGSSLLSTAPISYVSDKVDDKKRAQAIALLRTSGDVGFLVGASSMGALADWIGSLELAMQSSSGILFAATSWFALRNILTARLDNAEKASK